MNYLDPRTAEVIQRNHRAYAEATDTPPADIADSPAAYLSWLRDQPRRTTAPPRELSRAFLNRQRTPKPPAPRDPAYAEAAAHLATLPDLGIAAIDRAREQLGDVPYEQLVIHAYRIATNRRNA